MAMIKDVVVRKPTKQEEDSCKKWPIWTCEPSEFDWFYTEKETCLILEGDVTVTDGQNSVSFGPGDYVVFPVDLECKWKVKKAVRKHYNFG